MTDLFKGERLYTEAELDRAKREARVDGMEKALEVLEEEGWLGDSHRRIRALIAAERGNP